MAVVATGIAITLAVAGIMVAAIIALFAAVVMAVMAATVPTQMSRRRRSSRR